MIIVIGIAIAVMAACMVVLSIKVIKVEKTAVSNLNEEKATAVSERLSNTVTTYNNNFKQTFDRLSEQDKEIAEIIGKLENIAVSIGRLENDVTVVKRDEKEIRRYYMNFRDPQALPVYGAGVPWAKDYPCGEENEHE